MIQRETHHGAACALQTWLLLTTTLLASSLAAVSVKTAGKTDSEAIEPAVEETRLKLTYGITTDRKALITCEINVAGEETKQKNGNTMIDGGLKPIAEQSGHGEESGSAWQHSFSTVYLICPQVTTSFCYMDCTPNCILDDRGCQVPQAISRTIETCRYEVINPSRLLVHYVIVLEAVDRTGQWNCAYRGQRAAQPLHLRAMEQVNLAPSNSTGEPRGSHNVTQGHSGSPAGPSQGRQQTNSQPIRSDESRSPVQIKRASNPTGKDYQRNVTESTGGVDCFLEKSQSNLPGWLRQAMSKSEWWFLMIALLATSLVANIGLIIRCVMTKAYINSLLRGVYSKCLQRALCLYNKENDSQLAKMSKGCENHKLRHQSRFGRPNQQHPLNSRVVRYSPYAEEFSQETPLAFYGDQPNGTVSGYLGSCNTHSMSAFHQLPPLVKSSRPATTSAPANGGIHFGNNWRGYPVQDAVVRRDPLDAMSHEGLMSPTAVELNGTTFSPPTYSTTLDAVNISAHDTNAGSLTGSVVLTNDSASFVEPNGGAPYPGVSGTGLGIGTSGLPIMLVSPNPVTSCFAQAVRSPVSAWKYACPEHLEDQRPQALSGEENHSYPLSDDFSHLFTGSGGAAPSLRRPAPVRSPNPHLPSFMVQLPSGESALLICQTPSAHENHSGASSLTRRSNFSSLDGSRQQQNMFPRPTAVYHVMSTPNSGRLTSDHQHHSLSVEGNSGHVNGIQPSAPASAPGDPGRLENTGPFETVRMDNGLPNCPIKQQRQWEEQAEEQDLTNCQVQSPPRTYILLSHGGEKQGVQELTKEYVDAPVIVNGS